MIWRRLFAEFLATGLLLATVVGSGIMAERLYISPDLWTPTPNELDGATE